VAFHQREEITLPHISGYWYSKKMEGSREIALVDDEDNLRETIGFALEQAGYKVTHYRDGLEALESLEQNQPDMMILDIMMPRLDGIELLKALRRPYPNLPVIFLTSRDEEFDRVLGLELGADDYLTKPFSIRELQARIKAVFRRTDTSKPIVNEKILQDQDLILNPDRFILTWRGETLTTTVTEFRIFHSLMANPGHVKTREELLRAAYPEDTYVTDRSIDCHIKRLRKKLDSIGLGVDCIETVYGLGYRYRGVSL
jgi:two-component system response regulator ChvI